MRITQVRACAWLAAAVIALPCVQAAETPKKPAKAQRDKASSRKRASGTIARKADLNRLQKAMNAQLKLNQEQKKQIDGRISAYLKELEAAAERQRAQAAAIQAKPGKIRERIKAARESGDKKAAQAAVKELRELFGVSSQMQEQYKQLIKGLTEIVPADQRTKFQKIVAQQRTERSRRGVSARAF